MKLALISYEYPPFHGGGIGTFAANLADLMSNAGVEVHVITNRHPASDTGADPVEQSRENLFVHRVPALRGYLEPHPESPLSHAEQEICRSYGSSLFYSWAILPTLDRVIAEHGIDVIEVAECGAEAFAFLRRRETTRQFANVAVNVTVHSPIYEINKYNRISRFDAIFERRRRMEDACIRLADTLSAPCQRMRDILFARIDRVSTRAGSCELIHYPFRFDQIPASKDPARRPTSEPYLICPGRLEPRKGPQVMIQALRILAGWELRPHVVFVGAEERIFGSPMKEYLLSLAGPSLSSQLHFVAKTSRETLFHYFQNALACVCPSPWDNFPNTCIEALASGTPVIGSDNSGMVEMIDDGNTGWLFESENPAALADRLRWTLKNPDWVSKAAALAPADIRRRLNLERIAQQRLDLYQSAIDRRRRITAMGMPDITDTDDSPALPTGLSDLQVVALADLSQSENEIACWRTLDALGTDVEVVVGSTIAEELPGLAIEDLYPDLRRALRVGESEFVALIGGGDLPTPEFFTELAGFLRTDLTSGGATSWMQSEVAGVPDFAIADLEPSLIWSDPLPPCVIVRRSALKGLSLAWSVPPRFWLIDLLLQLWESGQPLGVVPGFRGTFATDVWDAAGLGEPMAVNHYLHELMERRTASAERFGWLWAGQAQTDFDKLDSRQATRRFRVALYQIEQDGRRRVALYGSGRHTRKLLPALVDAPIVAILDDNAAERSHFCGWPIIPPAKAIELGVDAVVLSSDAFEDRLWQNAAPLAAQGIAVYRLYPDSLLSHRQDALAKRFDLPTDGERLVLAGAGDELLSLWPTILERQARLAGMLPLDADTATLSLLQSLGLPIFSQETIGEAFPSSTILALDATAAQTLRLHPSPSAGQTIDVLS